MKRLLLEIVSGVLAEGERLPKEADLAEKFGVSRGVVRESLRSLEERGLISVRHGRGATIRPRRDWNLLDGDVLGALLRTNASADVLFEFLECRRLLEVEAAALAAERATADDLNDLASAFTKMSDVAKHASTNPAAEDLFHEADTAFHRAIIAASGNRVLSRVVEPVQHAFRAARRPTARPELRLQRALPEHKRILAAIAKRDPDAARQAMTAHLETVASYIREFEDASSAGDGAALERVVS